MWSECLCRLLHPNHHYHRRHHFAYLGSGQGPALTASCPLWLVVVVVLVLCCRAQTMARKIFAADQHSFRQSMQRALQDHKVRQRTTYGEPRPTALEEAMHAV